jgi:hypothetical protein
MAFTSRRIVTGHDAQGKAIVEEDAVFDSVPGVMDKTLQGVFLWGTDSAPADAHGPDPRKGKISLAPPPKGSVFRVLELPPGNEAHMHKTETVDYVIMLEGEVDMILDDGAEVHMNQGDFMIQRATWHGWVNRSKKPCKIVFVLMDSKKA